MIGTHEGKIRDRAYALWEQAGSPEGRDWEFWHAAERELAENEQTDTSEDAAEISPIPLVAGLINH